MVMVATESVEILWVSLNTDTLYPAGWYVSLGSWLQLHVESW